jgi:hypothetical protein
MAKTAVAAPIQLPAAPVVKCRVLKLGDGKISTGKHEPELGDVFFERNEEFSVGEDIARGLEDLGYAEII